MGAFTTLISGDLGEASEIRGPRKDFLTEFRRSSGWWELRREADLTQPKVLWSPQDELGFL
jgi:hypothetical protein